jgi:hypothetical protein
MAYVVGGLNKSEGGGYTISGYGMGGVINGYKKNILTECGGVW